MDTASRNAVVVLRHWHDPRTEEDIARFGTIECCTFDEIAEVEDASSYSGKATSSWEGGVHRAWKH